MEPVTRDTFGSYTTDDVANITGLLLQDDGFRLVWVVHKTMEMLNYLTIACDIRPSPTFPAFELKMEKNTLQTFTLALTGLRDSSKTVYSGFQGTGLVFIGFHISETSSPLLALTQGLENLF